MFGVVRGARESTPDPDACADLKFSFSIGIRAIRLGDPFDVAGALPGESTVVGVGIDALAGGDAIGQQHVEQIGKRGCNTYAGHGQQRSLHRGCSTDVGIRIIDDVGVHSVVQNLGGAAGGRPSRCRGSGGRLEDDVIRKQIGLGVHIGRLPSREVSNHPQGSRGGDVQRACVKRAGCFGGIRAVGGIAELGPGSGGGNDDADGSKINPAFYAEGSVGYFPKVGECAIDGPRSRLACVIEHGLATGIERAGDEFRKQQETTIVGDIVHAVNGQRIGAVDQGGLEGGDVDGLWHEGIGIGTCGGGGGIVGEGAGGVFAGNGGAVEEGGVAIVVAHFQRERGEACGIGGESFPQITGGVDAQHGRLSIRLNDASRPRRNRIGRQASIGGVSHQRHA